MKNTLFILAIVAGLTACGDGNKSGSDADSTTSPSTSDSTSTVEPMMGDTSQTVQDSAQ